MPDGCPLWQTYKRTHQSKGIPPKLYLSLWLKLVLSNYKTHFEPGLFFFQLFKFAEFSDEEEITVIKLCIEKSFQRNFASDVQEFIIGQINLSSGLAELAKVSANLEYVQKKTQKVFNRQIKELIKRNADLDTRRTELDTRQTELDTRRTELYKRNAELDARRTELDNRETKIDVKNGMLMKRFGRVKDLSKRKADIDTRQTELDARQTELDTRRTELDKRETRIKEKNVMLIKRFEREKKLSRREKELSRIEKELSRREKELLRREKDLEQFEKSYAQPHPTSPPQEKYDLLLDILFDNIFTVEVMDEPVIATDGYTYEKRCILEWFRTKRTSPTSGAVLACTTLIPNHSLKSKINQWREASKISKNLMNFQ